MRLIEKIWFKKHPLKWGFFLVLLPLSIIFWSISALRRKMFQYKVLTTKQAATPVVVVGNIGVGGNGKTPLTLFLVQQLQMAGIKVGVLSRGYGSKAPHYPYQVEAISKAEQAGDEPLLIYQRTKAPVVIGSDRIAAAKQLTELGCQLIIADDGLQHYRLHRDIELIVVDGKRGLGNGFLLPAGPLRETSWRLRSVPYVIVNGQITNNELNEQLTDVQHRLTMTLKATNVCHIKTGKIVPLHEFIRRYPIVNAIAGIGDPERFFSSLSALGFALEHQQGFVDHHHFTDQDFDFDSGVLPLIMTEKDQVKCLNFVKENWWYLPVDAQFDDTNIKMLINDIMALVARDC